MISRKGASDLDKYAPWIGVNRRLAGPVFVLSLVYIPSYLAVTFYLWRVGFPLTGLQQAGCLVGFGVFVVAIYLAFTGFLLRGIMRERNGSTLDRGTEGANKERTTTLANELNRAIQKEAPERPPQVVEETEAKYREALRLLMQNGPTEQKPPGPERAR